LLVVELQQKCLPTRVAHRIVTHLVPLVLGEPSYGLPELSPDEGEGVLDVVAVLVELSNLEPVLRGPEQQSQLPRIAERTPEENLLFIFQS